MRLTTEAPRVRDLRRSLGGLPTASPHPKQKGLERSQEQQFSKLLAALRRRTATPVRCCVPPGHIRRRQNDSCAKPNPRSQRFPIWLAQPAS